MKNRLVMCLLTLAIGFSPATQAYSLFGIPPENFKEPYAGISAIQTDQDYKPYYGKRVFAKNTQNLSIFGGFTFLPHWGTEAGLEWQPKRTKRPLLSAGDAPPGGAVIGGSNTAGFETYIEGYHPYVGVFHEVKYRMFGMHDITTFQTLLAASISYIKAREALLTANGAAVNSSQYNASVRKYSKIQLVPMLKFSALSYVTHNIGIRCALDYRFLSMFHSYSKTPNDSAEIKLKNVFGFGLGIVYSFK